MRLLLSIALVAVAALFQGVESSSSYSDSSDDTHSSYSEDEQLKYSSDSDDKHSKHSSSDDKYPRYDDKVCKDKGPQRLGYDDLGIRCNKFEMADDYDGYPIHLDWRDYPMSDDLAYKLSHYSTTESLVTHHDYETKGVCISHYIDEIGGYPTFPSKDPKSEFWDDLEEVVKAQKLRLRGKIPSFFTLPDLWRGWTAAQIAEAVHDEVRCFHCLQ